MLGSTRPLLTISLLASNRPDTIRRCLDSLAPIRKVLPCELILIDTSKSKEIHEILLEYTDQVYEFEWCKDFAKARNAGLERANGEWFLFLDDDEWFVDVDALIEFFQSGEYKEYGYANYIVRSFFDVHYLNSSNSWATRIFKIEEDTAFVGIVHEMFSPIRGACKDIPAVANHSGYIYTSEEQKKAHFERNATLLLEMIEREPGNMRWRLQLMQEYDVVSEWKKLQKCCEDALAYLVGRHTPGAILERASFLLGYVSALCNAKELEKCIQVCEDTLLDEEIPDAIKGIFILQLANCYLKKEAWAEAKSYADEYLDKYEHWNDKLESVVRKNAVPYLGEIYSERKLSEACGICIICDLQNRSVELLKKYYTKLGWKRSSVYSDAEVEQVLMRTLPYLPEDEMILEVLHDIYRNRGLSSSANKIVEELDVESSEFKKTIQILASLDVDEGMIWYARACAADWCQDETGVKNAVARFFDTAENVLCIPENMRRISQKYEIDIYAFWKQIKPITWREHVHQYVKEKDVEVIQTHMQCVFSKEDWRYQYFQMAAGQMEEVLFYRHYYRTEDGARENIGNKKVPTIDAVIQEVVELDREDADLILQCFHKFMCKVLEYYLAIYSDEAFEGEMEMLPAEAVAAVWLNEYFGKDATDWEGQIAALRECAMAYPAFGDKIKVLATAIAVQQKQYEENKKMQVQNELSQMVLVMKDKIAQMLEQGLEEQALAVIEQVRMLVPEDKELMEWENRLKG